MRHPRPAAPKGTLRPARRDWPQAEGAPVTALLAFDTASERMTIALSDGRRRWSRQAAGGAKASAALVPALLDLLGEAGLALCDLDAIAFGRGPGAFTGLRTACSVAQGLALGAARPVLPIDSLLAVAEDARAGASPCRVWALVDARMDQIYAAEYAFAAGRWTTLVAPMPRGFAPLALLGRWSLSFYMVHQPMLIGILAAVVALRHLS